MTTISGGDERRTSEDDVPSGAGTDKSGGDQEADTASGGSPDAGEES